MASLKLPGIRGHGPEAPVQQPNTASWALTETQAHVAPPLVEAPHVIRRPVSCEPLMGPLKQPRSPLPSGRGRARDASPGPGLVDMSSLSTSLPLTSTWRTPSRIPGKTFGTYYEFLLKDMGVTTMQKEVRHMDFTFKTGCNWDQGLDALEADVMHINTRYNRLFYTWSMKSRGPTEEFQKDLTTFDVFKKEGHLSLEQFAHWINNIQPRAVHDLKPLLVLLQGAFGCVLDGKFTFFSSEVERLQQQLLDALQIIRDLEAELEALKKKQKGGGVSAKLAMRASVMSMKDRRREALEAAGAASAEHLRTQREQDRARHAAELAEVAAAKDAEIDRLKAMLAASQKSGSDAGKELEEERRRNKQLVAANKKLKEQLSSSKCARCDGWDLCDSEGCPRCRGRELNDAGADGLAGLEILFGEDGAWQFVSSLDEAREMAGLAMTYMKKTFGINTEITRIGYAAEIDMDGEDDPSSYNDNTFEVVKSFRLNRFPGLVLKRDQAVHNYESANGRVTVAAEVPDGNGAVHYFAPINIARDPDDNLGEVWGCIEGTPCRTKEDKEAMKLFATGMGRIYRRLKMEEEQAVKEIAASVGSRNSITKLRSAFKTGILRQMHSDKPAPDKDPRTIDMETLKWLNQQLANMQRHREEIDRMLDGEQMRNAMMQIKSYRKPPEVIVDVIMALFTALGHTSFWEEHTRNQTGAKIQFKLLDDEEDERMIVPEDRLEVWQAIAQRFQVHQTIKAMSNFLPETNVPNGAYKETRELPKSGKVLNVTKMRDTTVAVTLAKVDRKMAQRASVAVGLIREWLYVTRRISLIYTEQKEVQDRLGIPSLGSIPGYHG